jgi:hypothetical protein
MNPLATLKIIGLIAGLFAFSQGVLDARDKDFDAVDGPNVRVMRHDDGSRTMFMRSPDKKKLTKKKMSANGVLTMMTIYWMDSNGNPTGCRIYDGQNEPLFRVKYGFRKGDLKLVKEKMYDARTPRKDPNTGEEMPVQTITYVYDAEGNRSAPIIFNHFPGKTFEQVFGVKSSALETNPFNENTPGALANPNARRVGR